MNDKQLRRFYFPAWNAAARVHDWRMIKGRLLGVRAEAFGSPEVNAIYQAVWTAAEQMALHHHRAVTADDLRHGCTVVALGRYKSSKDFTNKEADRAETLFRLLKNPDDIDAMMDWTDPERAARRRVVWVIENAAPEAYVRRIAQDKFGTASWENLTTRQLGYLAMTLKERSRSWNRKRNVEQEIAEVTEGDPF